MAAPKFTPSLDLIGKSYRLIKEHFVAVLWLVLLPALLMNLGQLFIGHIVEPLLTADPLPVASQFWQAIVDSDKGRLGLGLSLVGFVWAVVVFAGVLVGSLRAAKGEPFDPVHTLRDSWQYYWRLLGLTLLIVIMVELGLFLFIIPGVILLRMYLLAPFYLIEYDLGVIESLKVSARKSKLSPGPIYGTIGVMIWLLFGSVIAGTVPLLGPILSLVVSYIFLFGPALRFVELNQWQPLPGKTKVSHRRKTSKTAT
ncbi:hypothetical protein KDA23_01925 [Candidatus Saccharibacteria bacterium]|nr:hypothetical protein [Candidatus Saccharibacteria bacterium]